MIDRQTATPQQQGQHQQQQGPFGPQDSAGGTDALQMSPLAAAPQSPRPITDWASI